MADRYWVGGTANWDATAGTKWATTSGGAGGASVPTSADDVYFDSASTGTVTPVTAQAICRTLSTSGFTGTITGSGTIIIHGGLTIGAGTTWSHTGSMDIRAASGSFTITTAGKTLGATTFGFTGSSTATWTLGDALTVGGSITVTSGTFDTGNYNVTATALSSNNSNTRTINLGSSTITLSTNTALILTSTTNMTFNAGTSQINLSGTTATINSGGLTFNNVAFTSTTAGVRVITGANTFSNLSVTAPSSAGVAQLTFDSRQTINGTLSTTGTAGNRRVWFSGATYGIAQTLTINSAPSLTDADFRDIYVIGTAAPISGTRIGDLRGIRGITASTPKTVYWNLAAGGNWSANAWAASSGAGVSTDHFPLAQDTAVIENTGLNTSATVTIDNAMASGSLAVSGINMSTRTNAMTLTNGTVATTIYGDWTNGSGTTIAGTSALVFSGRNTQTITSAGKSFTQPITIDSYGGTVQLADALDIGSNNLTVTNGTFDTKNFNVTAGTLSSSNSNVRTITLGSSTLTLSGASPVTFTTATNLTLNAGTSQITCSGAGANFNGGGMTFSSVSFTTTSTNQVAITGTNTFANLTATAPASAGLTPYALAANQTITGTLTCTGATAVRRIFVRSDTLGTTRTLTVGTLSAQDCDFRDITIAGAAAGSSPTRAGDCGGNSGITFPAPKTVYWNLAGAQNWSATAWAPGSGGTPDINNFPLAQDTAVFNEAAGSVTGTITINAAWNIGTFDASLRTSAMTLTTSTNTPTVYGDWKFGTGVTSSSTTGTITFATRGTETITSNGVSFGCPVTIDSFSGTVNLADALTLGSARTLTLTSGTFDAVSYNVTTGLFATGSGTKTLKMGSGTWTLSGTGSVWDASGGTTNFFKGTANIVLSDTSTAARTFLGNNFSYNRLTIGGTTGTSTLTFNNNNQFTELASTKTVAHTIALGTTSQTFGKWTVTGTVGNVVTVTGTATITIAGACTSGLDYLALGTTTVSATSPGEFYAGANSTATGATAPLYLTAKPADSTRYWVGGTGNWSDTARWSDASGGSSGFSVPRSHDDVVFDSLSNATAYTATVNTVTGGIRMKSLTIAGPASGNVTLAGSAAMVGIHGNVTLPATGLTRTYTGVMTLSGSSTGRTFTTNGVTLASAITVNGVDCGWSLGSALNIGTEPITLTNGSLNFNSYNVTAGLIASNVSTNARSINFGSGTTTLSSVINFGTTEAVRADLTVTASTSQINFSATSLTLSGNNQTFYNVSFTSTSAGTVTINGTNSFNNLSFTGITAAGLKNISLSANQTVTGTLTLSAGTNATMRHFVRSDTIGTTRTLTCAAVASLTDVDFRDITIAGAAAPVSGTRLGDCKGNSGITFDAAKTVYWALTTGANWESQTGSVGAWSDSIGGTRNFIYFPLAQDAAVFPSTGLPSGGTVTIGANYNIGTIDMSARTSNTMTLATGTTTPAIYGNWTNGTGTTLTGTGVMTFAGRGSQTIRSEGKTFTQPLTINTPGGSVTLQDALNIGTNALTLTNGTFDANIYNVTAGRFDTNNTNTRTVKIGSGTWTLSAAGSTSGTAPWVTSSGFSTAASGLTVVAGTGTISFTSATNQKDFFGGGLTYPTINQGGAGSIRLGGNNTFANITNTFVGATTIEIGIPGTSSATVNAFTASGSAGNLLTLSSTAATPSILIFTGSGTAANVDYLTIDNVRAYPLTTTWYAGANSTNNGSLGWYFEAAPAVVTATGNFLFFFN